MAVKLKNELPDDICRVHVGDVASGYPNNPPYTRCAIVCGMDKIPHLMDTYVFEGTYEDCLAFVKENCENHIK